MNARNWTDLLGMIGQTSLGIRPLWGSGMGWGRREWGDGGGGGGGNGGVRGRIWSIRQTSSGIETDLFGDRVGEGRGMNARN
jgi:hypothetical protein